jgi:secondary thiamine-phosphate synthase enzyme
MTIRHEHFTIQSEARVTFEDVTDKVLAIAKETGVKNGILQVYSQHTTCAVVIQEQSDDTNFYGTQFVLQDMVNGLSTLFPTCTSEGQYLHPGAMHIDIAKRERAEEAWWSLNTDAHLRSVMLARSVSIPLADGNLILGEFGRIYFGDFDQTRARQRTVWVSVLGE